MFTDVSEVLAASIIRAMSTRQPFSQNALFRRGDYRKKGHKLGKLSWVLVPVKFPVRLNLMLVEEYT
jgi:hypothetical protein